MSTPSVPEPDPDVVIPQAIHVALDLTPGELTEIRRGLVQRLSVATSNLREHKRLSHDDLRRWSLMQGDCWSAYEKLRYVDAPKATIQEVVRLTNQDEFEYLSNPPQ